MGSSCWAELESGAAQPAHLPVTFSDGFTIASLTRSDPAWQQQYIHLHPDSKENVDPSFVHIGQEAPAVKESLDKVDSTVHIVGSSSPSSALSACSYTFMKDPGYKIVLERYGDGWQAMVHDNCFPGLSRS